MRRTHVERVGTRKFFTLSESLKYRLQLLHKLLSYTHQYKPEDFHYAKKKEEKHNHYKVNAFIVPIICRNAIL